MRYKNFKKYKIPDERYRELMYFSCQYPEWKRQLAEVAVLGSPAISGMPSGSGVSDPTGSAAISYGELMSKVKLVEQCAKESDPEIWFGVLKGVTTRNCTPNWLRAKGYLHCGNEKYYMARRKYYWLLDQRRG